MQHVSALTLELAPSNSAQLECFNAPEVGAFFQGALLECVDAEYASVLHHLAFNPYSQYCYKSDNGDSCFVWKVCALTDEATERILYPASKLERVELRASGVSFDVIKKTQETISLKALSDSIYQHPQNGTSSSSRRYRINFLTPTAFKSKRQYVIMPTPRLMIQNLLMRYNYLYGDDKEVDAETLDYLDQRARITSYRLQSHYFPHAAENGKKIPAFWGSVVLGVNGNDSASGLIGMLFRFGEYAGIGIKTSMGMGGCTVAELSEQSRRREDRRE